MSLPPNEVGAQCSENDQASRKDVTRSDVEAGAPVLQKGTLS